MLHLTQSNPILFLLLAFVALSIVYKIVKLIIALMIKALILALFLLPLYIYDSCNTQKPVSQNQVDRTSVSQNSSPRTEGIKRVSENDFTPHAPTGNVYIVLYEKYWIRQNANYSKRQINRPASVKKYTTKDETFYIIIVGPFSSKEEAQDFPFTGKIIDKSQMNSIY